MFTRRLSPTASLLLLALASCRGGGGGAAPAIVQPGAPGQDSRVVDAVAAADLSKVGYTPADVRFMQGMIGHHAQALEMTGIVRSRSEQRRYQEAGAAHRGVAGRRDQDDAGLADRAAVSRCRIRTRIMPPARRSCRAC